VSIFIVADKQFHGTKITYKIADATSSIVLYKAVVNFNKKAAVWKYIGANDGLIVNDRDIRNAIDRAIDAYNGRQASTIRR
jgi:hypothetical protein